MRTRLLAATLIVFAALICAAQAAENYPCNGTVRLIVPFPAGAATDIQARLIAQYLGPRLDRTVIVENKPGADGAIAVAYAFSQDPDGCSYLFLTNGIFGVGPMSGDKIFVPDLLKFVPVTNVAQNTQFLVVATDSPVKTVQDLVADAKRRPEGKPATYGTGNTSGYVAGALFAALSGAPMQRIPYKGEPAMVANLISGFVSSAFPLTAFGHVTGGRLRALAVMSDRRFTGLPEVPAITEKYPAFQDLVRISPHGTLAGPPGLPQEIAERLSREVNDILRMPEVVAGFRAIGSEPVGSTPVELAAYYRRQVRDWGRIVKEYKIETSAK